MKSILLYSIVILSAHARADTGNMREKNKERGLVNWGWGGGGEDPYGDVKVSYGDSPYDHSGYGGGKSGYGGGKSGYGGGKSGYGGGKSGYGGGKSGYGGGKSGYGGYARGPSDGKGGYGGYHPYYVDPDREKNKCESHLASYMWDYLYYLGFKFPSWCCLLSALAPPYHDPAYDFKPDYEHVKYVVEAIFKTAKKEHEMSDDDLTQAFQYIAGGSPIGGEESEYIYCDLGYHKCQLIYGLMYAFREGFSACYCYYRSFQGCECASCMDLDLWVDEISAYKGLPDYGEGVLVMETDAGSGYFFEKLIYTRIATCVQCPGYPPRPFNKCYGYCNLIKALRDTEQCFPEDHADDYSP